MKNFFSSFLGALLGVIVSAVLFVVFIIAIVIAGLGDAMKLEDEVNLKKNSILLMDLSTPIPERDSDNPLSGFSFTSFQTDQGIGLDQIIENIKKAKSDSMIKGIYLNLTEVGAGMATLEEIRNALLDFKTSKKFIISYSEMYTQKGYYLSSVADKIYLNPQGGFDFKGLSMQIMFYKKALENLNVDVQIFRHGKFKSAIEPFMLEKMSEANRAQSEAFLGSLWNRMLEGISVERKVSIDWLNKIADDLLIQNPQDASNLKLVDGLLYYDEVIKQMKSNLKIKDEDKISFVSMKEYKKVATDSEDKEGKSKDKIAVIYAVGEIESGEGDDQTIGSDRIAKAIRDARLNKSVKGIVLRVNSPGGSALASDVMWREVTLAKKEKPFVVSMGDVAASGGYYISCAADKIYAQPNTITGSIGVFGMIPNAQKMLSDKIGITIDTVNTNKHSDMGTLYRGVTEDERKVIQKGVEDVYDTFTGRVAEGRKMKQAEVDSVGQGRVWSGTDALKIGLVDELGGIKDAIVFAAKKAKIDQYKIVNYPKQKDIFSEIFEKKKEEAETALLYKTFGESYKYVKNLRDILKMKGIQARMPFEMIIE